MLSSRMAGKAVWDANASSAVKSRGKLISKQEGVSTLRTRRVSCWQEVESSLSSWVVSGRAAGVAVMDRLRSSDRAACRDGCCCLECAQHRLSGRNKDLTTVLLLDLQFQVSCTSTCGQVRKRISPIRIVVISNNQGKNHSHADFFPFLPDPAP
jgi:hypothetical protein